MRYFILFMALFADIAVIAVAWWMHYIGLTYITIIAFFLWYRDGGFSDWRPSTIKAFLKNAKEAGL